MVNPKPNNVATAPPSKTAVFDSNVELLIFAGTVGYVSEFMNRATAPPMKDA